MANKRTFLAWIRTSIGIMAFGFVIKKFIIPLNYGNKAGGHCLFDEHQYFPFLGIFLVSLGAATGLLSTYRFRKTERQIVERCPYFCCGRRHCYDLEARNITVTNVPCTCPIRYNLDG